LSSDPELTSAELVTHTLQLENKVPGKITAILIASGPLTNIDATARDPSSGRSQIRRSTITSPAVPQTWLSGQLIAYGIRNPAGFAFPPSAISPVPLVPKLYVVENGASIDNVTGLTPIFVNDNPGSVVWISGLYHPMEPPSRSRGRASVRGIAQGRSDKF
jgi:hypothetical protein